MDFSPSPEQESLRDAARRVATEVFGRGHEASIMSQSDRGRLAELGFLGISMSAEYGGLGGTLLDALLVLEQFAQISLPAAFQVFEANCGAARVVELFGTAEQRRRWLPSVVKGTTTIAVAISEPDAGSAATDLTTVGSRTDRGWRITGRKRWCSGAGSAELYLVYARLSPEPGARGIGAVLVERDTPGLAFGSQERLMGLNAIPSADMVFEGVEVPDAAVVVKPGGFGRLFSAFSIERLGNATMSLAIAQACLDRAADYVLARKQYGKAIAEFQLVQGAVADMIVNVETARLLIYRAASEAGSSWPSALSSSIAKYHANEVAKRVSDLAIQLHGAYGYSQEYGIEQMHRDAHGWAIAGGTANMQRIRIASEYLGRRFDQRSPQAMTRDHASPKSDVS